MKRIMLKLLCLLVSDVALAAKESVLIGLDAEFDHKSTSYTQAVQKGMEIAIDAIN
jgi:hypothetical protein